MAVERDNECRGQQPEEERSDAALLARLAAIREEGKQYRADPRDSTEILRELRNTVAR